MLLPVKYNSLETPPRVWRKRLGGRRFPLTCRNTSTCVEKTRYLHHICEEPWKHLHVCGENGSSTSRQKVTKETPPRVWRKPLFAFTLNALVRNTSTCVEKTFAGSILNRLIRKHLHVCGENDTSTSPHFSGQETPPRVWRKLLQMQILLKIFRNTSTCVEKTTA